MNAGTPARSITVLLVDDEPGVRRGLRMRLAREDDLTVVGEAADGTSAFRLASAERPDVVLLDVALPAEDGVEIARHLRSVLPDSAVVLLSVRDDVATRTRGMTAGATALIGKHEPIDVLLRAIRSAAAGQR